MCGITGFLSTALKYGHDDLKAIVATMANTLHHRGPDDNGIWVDAHAGIALGHVRLSILDLSSEGHQPMFSGNERFVIVFNGEIYNFSDIRRELEAGGNPILITLKWRGHSDTEVMLAAFEKWGVEAAVRRFVGMFAFGLWDRQERTLYLVRDRLGEKPLYYGWMGNTFLFSSELKALRAHPDFRGEVDRNVLALFLRHNYVPAPYSIYKGIHKLLPGTILKIPSGSITQNRSLVPEPYWSVREAAENGVAHPFKGTEAEAVRHLDTLLRETVRHQMVADVPLGAFLSGGVDSSTIVALMQAQSSRPIRTFTIGFHERGYNEAEHAGAVACHLGTEHTELYLTSKEAMSVIPQLPILYDEPFSDSSQVPTFLISQLTRRHVTVSLSGDGGDELFGGYNRYFWASSIWKTIGWLPRGTRRVVASAMMTVRPEGWERLFTVFSPFIPKNVRQRLVGDKMYKLAEILTTDDAESLYFALVSHWKHPATIVPGANEPITTLTDHDKWAEFSDFTSRMMYLDAMTYLPDDIMVKVDRASMGVSLESRAPYLDHRVVEFAWQLPAHMKIRGQQGKWLLRQVLYQYVPKELIERPKMGFGVPIDSWLRGPLREWSEDLLEEKRLRAEGFFDPGPIREKWTEHLSGERDWQYYLWDILMFQAWKDHWH
jgi:asparagine synthase (glutamine-hydrolysing)